jgi:hypothetical protein
MLDDIAAARCCIIIIDIHIIGSITSVNCIFCRGVLTAASVEVESCCCNASGS